LRDLLVALLVGQLLHLFEIRRDGVREVTVALDWQIRLRHAQDQPSHRLRERRRVGEARVDELWRDAPTWSVGRVIDTAAAALAAIADMERGNPEVLQEAGIIRSGSQRSSG